VRLRDCVRELAAGRTFRIMLVICLIPCLQACRLARRKTIPHTRRTVVHAPAKTHGLVSDEWLATPTRTFERWQLLLGSRKAPRPLRRWKRPLNPEHSVGPAQGLHAEINVRFQSVSSTLKESCACPMNPAIWTTIQGHWIPALNLGHLARLLAWDSNNFVSLVLAEWDDKSKHLPTC
jgi:hypothetical protein